MLLVLLALVASASAAATAAAVLPQAGDKITLDVYIEALCPYSFNFVNKQLGPQYESIAPFVDVRVIPYGNAHTEETPGGGYNFTCQHGPQECDGNLWMSCANQHSPDTAHSVNFTVCLMKYPGYQSKCARDTALDFQVLTDCHNGAEGPELVHQNGVETDSLVPKKLGVPWIVFNKNWDPILQDQAQDNLKATCCKLAPKDTPACQ